MRHPAIHLLHYWYDSKGGAIHMPVAVWDIFNMYVTLMKLLSNKVPLVLVSFFLD